MELMVSIHGRCSVGDLTCLWLLSQNMYFTMKSKTSSGRMENGAPVGSPKLIVVAEPVHYIHIGTRVLTHHLFIA